eukprot:11341389-Ditylum_brightwellii.AAC.1
MEPLERWAFVRKWVYGTWEEGGGGGEEVLHNQVARYGVGAGGVGAGRQRIKAGRASPFQGFFFGMGEGGRNGLIRGDCG